ncbi:polysaccharide deacetylase family protein [Deinococcus knuensis]|uniref:Polysaccharide deacetylase n=1 Tax=Deinococcus knuensis TaxID=1837380 RepID=A0ABQ2SCH5_9DEIO|nr:polysaccharide deacetylase family protein [Deinococcus knuensis]GGS17225.1 polysaccharide deacetylase [Deinococcus knuensis]
MGGCLGLLALTDLLGRAAGLGALGAGSRHAPRVALTFDDGPGPRTPDLLAVLAGHGAHATFFVTEPACRAHPEELRALHAAGHQVEAHGRWHRHALLLPPWQEWAQVAWHPRADQSGPHLYRPPYGGHSPLTRLLARLTGRQIALWDVESRDWTALPAGELAAQTLARTRPGSVILLHDGPQVTPELLGALLTGLRERGLKPVTLNDLRPHRIGLREGWTRLRGSYGR